MTREEWAKRPRRESVRKRLGDRIADRVLLRGGGRCAHCGGDATEIDHVVPRALGGDDATTNLVGSCRGCNASRKHRELSGPTLRRLRVLARGRLPWR